MEMMEKTFRERVELHLHTSVSQRISTVRMKNACELAEAEGMDALAVTSLHSVQDFSEIAFSSIHRIYGVEIRYPDENGQLWGMSLLAKNQKGLQVLYRIVSAMETDGSRTWVPAQQLQEKSADLFYGSCGRYGQLYHALEEDQSPQLCRSLAAGFDYLEIYPAADAHEQQINQKIYALGKELGIPVTAVGNCCYETPDDALARQIILHGKGVEDESAHEYFRSTRDMLKEFAYLGREAAYETVITNTNAIADQIERVQPLQEEYPGFTLPNAQVRVEGRCQAKLTELYGENPPTELVQRYQEELEILKTRNYLSYYLLFSQIADFIREKGYALGFRGTIGSSFVAFLAGMTDVNPLRAHVRCPACKYTEFVDGAISGYDLPAATCPVCGQRMVGDGHNIPYETCLGTDGALVPDVDFNVPVGLQKEVCRYLEQLLGKDRVAAVGIYACFSERTVWNFLARYQQDKGVEFSQEEHDRLAGLMCGIKRADGRHPGGLAILPEGMDFSQLTPVITTRDHSAPVERVTHLSLYGGLDRALYKVDVLGHYCMDMISQLHQSTGVRPEEIDYADPKLYALFTGTQVLGITPEDIDGVELGTLGLPEFNASFVRQLCKKVAPENFSDLVRISGMAHGTQVWLSNGENLLAEHGFRNLIGDRDDVFLKMRSYGANSRMAYRMMRLVRTGRFCRDNPENQRIRERLIAGGVPQWLVDSMGKIRYLFPKAHAVSYVKMAMTMAWFKLYYPDAFYQAWLKDAGELLEKSDEELDAMFPDEQTDPYEGNQERERLNMLLVKEWRARTKAC